MAKGNTPYNNNFWSPEWPFFLRYAENAKKDKILAGHLEISTTALIFNCTIRLYYQGIDF